MPGTLEKERLNEETFYLLSSFFLKKDKCNTSKTH